MYSIKQKLMIYIGHTIVQYITTIQDHHTKTANLEHLSSNSFLFPQTSSFIVWCSCRVVLYCAFMMVFHGAVA